MKTIVSIFVLLALGSVRGADDPARLGGDASIDDAGVEAFGFFAPSLSAEEHRAFAVGNSFFKQNWVTAPASVSNRDGLGPLFNATSCSACHPHDGRGRPPTADETSSTGLLLRLGVRGDDGRIAPHPLYGGHVQDHAILDRAPEARWSIESERIAGRYDDGEPYELLRPRYALRDLADGPAGDACVLAPRVAPAIIGLGLLEAIPEDAIRARADPDDRDGDGVSGRAATVVSASRSGKALGRFGWKAVQATVADQVATALANDIGITSRVVARDDCTTAQCERLRATSAASEISDQAFDALAFYARTLAVPLRRGADDADALRGERLFATIGCAARHVQRFETGHDYPIAAYRGQVVRPLTDLLLHDMGPELADGFPEGDASGSEWRTPPLWGIGLIETVNEHNRLMHDGRARGISEAILWHGGEAQRARDAFKALPRADRAALVAFLRSL